MENEERAPARAGGKGKRKVPKLAGFGTISEINTLPGSVTFGVERAERRVAGLMPPSARTRARVGTGNVPDCNTSGPSSDVTLSSIMESPQQSQPLTPLGRVTVMGYGSDTEVVAVTGYVRSVGGRR